MKWASQLAEARVSDTSSLGCQAMSTTVDSSHDIKWEETTVFDMATHPSELLLKEAIYIHMTPAKECLNRDCQWCPY